MVNVGCLQYKEGHHDVARQKFTEALNITGYQV
jgi:hypothetical protein